MSSGESPGDDPGRDGRIDSALSAPGCVVVGANWYRFRAGERIRYGHVASVALIWAVRGSGWIGSGGHGYELVAGSVLVLPWMHDVDYRPDDRSPFQLGTVHLVPRHAAHVPVSPHVPYLDDDPLLRSSGRGGDGGPRRAVAASDHVPAGRRLLSLGSYCVERWGEGFDTRIFGPLAELLLAEIRACSAPGDEVLGVPAALAAMTEHILANLDSPLTVAEIARAGGCSTATAARLFARHTGRSVQAWVREQRMRRAAVLLRSTGMRVGEVAREVGYADPLYFSRVFTATHSVPPSRYAREGIRL